MSFEPEDFFQATLSDDLPDSSDDGEIALSQTPIGTFGWVILDYDDPAKREKLKYYDIVDGLLQFRGIDRPNPKEHLQGAPVMISDSAEYFKFLSDLSGTIGYIEKVAALQVKIWGGAGRIGKVHSVIADETITLTDNATNYLYLYLVAGSVEYRKTTVEATAKGDDAAWIGTVVTSAGAITSIEQGNIRSFGLGTVDGLQGDTGIQGDTGVQGDTGIQGVTGVIGLTGIQGDTGIQGVTGITGATGTQGVTGVTGATGTQGDTGTQGTTGITGGTGTQGNTGIQGTTGVTGGTGVQGNTGAMGATGIQGDTGVVGATGSQGDTGLDSVVPGPPGSQGIQGDTGTQGDTGIVGLPGAQGDTGVGTQGDTGTIGLTGNTGVTGATGIGHTGVAGATGAVGPTGATGVVGATGIPGEAASAGDTGLTGATGPQGDSGLSGSGSTEFFLQTEADGVISNYQQFVSGAPDDAEATLTAVCDNGTGQVQLGSGGNAKSFITDSDFPGTTIVPSGIWAFDLYLNIDSNTGVTQVVAKAYKRTTGGSETELFSVTSPELTTGLKNVEFETSQPNFSINGDDRIVIKFFAVTTSAGSRTVTLYYEGTTNFSHVHLPFILRGDTGIQGNTGVAGAVGNTGVAGPAGNTGVTGATGTVGATGTAGSNGSQGDTGVHGNTGVTGATGTAGAVGATGTAGAAGATGVGNTGVTGATGVFNEFGFRFLFNDSTTDADPGSGKFLLTAADRINISETDADSNDITDWLAIIDALTAAGSYGFLVIRKAAAPTTNFIVYSVGGGADEIGYYGFDLFVVTSAGSFSNNDPCYISLSTSGPAGNDGSNGDQGDTGVAGAVGATGTAGAAGNTGVTGATGTAGTVGATGTAGAAGNTGVTGATGTFANPLTTEIDLGENAGFVLDAVMSADGKYSGIVRAGTAGAALSFGDLCYLDPTDSRWEKTDANAAAGADGDARGVLGICVLAAAGDGSATKMLRWGIVRAASFPAGMAVNSTRYVSETAGAHTVTQPTTTDAVIRVIGFAETSDEIFFNPSPDYITHT